MRPALIEQFPGLDLRRDPGEPGGALDLLNVSLEPGRVRTREGSSLFYTSPANVMFLDAFNSASVGRQLIIGSTGGVNGTYSAVSPAGSLVASTAAAVGIIDDTGCSGVAIGTPAASAYYVVSARSTFINKWTGAAWSLPAGMPANPTVLSISPTDNRLVVCDIGSEVWFSDPGAPETFGANNFVQLTPGDGETIQAAAVFNNQLFIFKSSKFFVFYGTSVDGTGKPVFNYRPVSAGVGPQFRQIVTPSSVCVGPDGVYFVTGDSIYRTTGGPAVNVGAPLQPFFNATTGPFWQSGAWTPTGAARPRIAWVGDKMYVSLPGSVARRTFVYDRRLDAWTVWGLASTAITAFASSNADGALDASFFGIGVAAVKLDASVATDQGAAMVSRYRTAFQNFGDPGDKKLREVILEGIGTPTLKVARNAGSLDAGAAVTLGVSPAYATGRRARAFRAREFSLELGAASGAWSVRRMECLLTNKSRSRRVTA